LAEVEAVEAEAAQEDGEQGREDFALGWGVALECATMRAGDGTGI